MSPLASPSSTPNSPLDVYDLLWATECDHVPEHNGSWPSGMYAQDMAWAFTHLQGTWGDVEIHIHQVFPNAAWSRRLTTDTKMPFLDKCSPKSRSGGHCPDWQVAYGPIGSQL